MAPETRYSDLGEFVAQTMVLRVAKIAAGWVVALAVALKLARRRGPRS